LCDEVEDNLKRLLGKSIENMVKLFLLLFNVSEMEFSLNYSKSGLRVLSALEDT
jgi:hypothetical protein